MDREAFSLLKDLPGDCGASSPLRSGVVDLRKNLRQDDGPVLEREWNLDNVRASFEAKCVKNLGKTGKHPTIIPIAISANLCRYQ